MELSKKMYNVLLIEDDPDHIELISSELKNSRKINKIYVSYDGEEALNFLFNPQDISEDKLEPLDFILLDLKMPKVDGFQVLKRVKDDPQFRRITTIILTTSTSSDDRQRAETLGADGYIIKDFGSLQMLEDIFRAVCS